jgi:hypothetical protein
MTHFRTVPVDGLNIFYRETGSPSNPKLLLLGGFPASSYQFRNPSRRSRTGSTSSRAPIPVLATRTCPTRRRGRIRSTISPTSSTSSSCPSAPPARWASICRTVAGRSATGSSPGTPNGCSGKSSNANTCEEGFTAVWDGIRHALWVNRTADTEAPLETFLQPDTVKAIYTTGHRDLTGIGSISFSSLVGMHIACSSTSSTTTGRTPPCTRPGRSRSASASRSLSSSGDRATSSSRLRVATHTCGTSQTQNLSVSTRGTAVEDHVEEITEHIVRFYDQRVVASPHAA